MAEANEESEANGVPEVWMNARGAAWLERHGDGIRCGGARSRKWVRVAGKKTQLQQSAEGRGWRPLLLGCGCAGMITQAGNWLLAKTVAWCDGCDGCDGKNGTFYICPGRKFSINENFEAKTDLCAAECEGVTAEIELFYIFVDGVLVDDDFRNSRTYGERS